MSYKKTKTDVLLVGSGRMARHFSHYLQLKSCKSTDAAGCTFDTWARSSTSTPLSEIVKQYSLIFLAISDDSLNSVIDEIHHHSPTSMLVHFSGGRSFNNAIGIHPLMTFGNSLFDEKFYDQIPLVTDTKDLCEGWFQSLPNPKFYLAPEQKSFYHGLCHLAGNYPKFLWIEIARIFEKEFHLPALTLLPFLQEILRQSLSENPDRQTGVFARKDTGTIDSHLKALNQASHLKKSYEAFLKSYKEVHP